MRNHSLLSLILALEQALKILQWLKIIKRY